jgi:hypothetical protein
MIHVTHLLQNQGDKVYCKKNLHNKEGAQYYLLNSSYLNSLTQGHVSMKRALSFV